MRALDLLDVEALFRGELHELRVLGVAKLSVLVLCEPPEWIWSFMKSVLVVHRGRSVAPPRYPSAAASTASSARVERPGAGAWRLPGGRSAAPGCVRSPRPAPCAYAARCRRPPRRGRRRRRRPGCAAAAAPLINRPRRGRCFPARPPGRSGAPQRTAKYASPARSEAKSPSPRVPSGKIPSTPPRSSTPSALGDRRAVGGRRGPPSSCPMPRRNGSSGPTNASFLIRKCTGRGAVPISIGPSMLCEWLTARITGPLGGHPPGAEHAGPPQPVHQPDADAARPTAAPRASDGLSRRPTGRSAAHCRRPASPRRG